MMNSIRTVCLLFTLSCFINAVIPQPIDKTRLHNIIRESMNSKSNSMLAQDPVLARLRLASIPAAEKQSDSLKNERPIRMKVRDSWDSEEDHYFSWASQNRRPMEPIPGRRRLVRYMSTALPGGRINGGIWRSGIVG